MGTLFLVSLVFCTSFIILRPLLGNVKILYNCKGKVFLRELLVMGDWVLNKKPFIYISNYLFKCCPAQICTSLYFNLSCSNEVE